MLTTSDYSAISAALVFVGFQKIARYSRECTVTEKIDGTCSVVFNGPNGEFLTGSRTRWITPEDDNFGFSRWAHEHKEELQKLGPGRHFGEWWGRGIQRNYGLEDRRFSLFNVTRWYLAGGEPCVNSKGEEYPGQRELPACVGLVPRLWVGSFDGVDSVGMIRCLAENGSVAAPGFMKPEGIVIYHSAANVYFKKTIEGDDIPKSLA